ncbi:hypothetical protein [Actinotalea sp. C106]|uniref:hypothetical protein n=1 Tax=Actinotalea sp. C106 TaxID=2908644 RepID=UPI0020284BF6|nr:hypothetical protein [Actinotalea sp. C106]
MIPARPQFAVPEQKVAEQRETTTLRTDRTVHVPGANDATQALDLTAPIDLWDNDDDDVDEEKSPKVPHPSIAPAMLRWQQMKATEAAAAFNAPASTPPPAAATQTRSRPAMPSLQGSLSQHVPSSNGPAAGDEGYWSD